MNTISNSKAPLWTALIASGIAVLLLGAWFLSNPTADLAVSLPGADGRPESMPDSGGAADLVGKLDKLDGVPADLPGDWPHFRGKDFDNIVKDAPKLADSWPKEGPKTLWKVELGEGHAAAAVWKGRVFVLDYDEQKRSDVVRCFSLADGREIWRRGYPVSVKRNHGMSRTVPAVTDDCLVTLGPRCHVVCLNPATGEFRWGIDMQAQYGTTEPLWYAGQCPLIENGQVILAPAGKDVLMTGVDAMTGQVLWKTPNTKRFTMSHSSVMPITIAGKRMYVYAALGGIAGVSAEAADLGAPLWDLPWNARVAAPSPVLMDDGKIHVTAGYGFGSLVFQVRKNGDAFVAESLFQKGPEEFMACEQQTPIFTGGMLYGIMPKDGGALRSQFVCFKPDGALAWSSGQDQRFGLGPFLLADNKFFLLSDDGMLTMIKADAGTYAVLGQARIFDGQDAWGPLALAGTRMILRDSKQMACIELGAAAP